MTTLLIADYAERKTVSGDTMRALSAALALSEPVDLLVAGADCRAVAESAAKLDGVNRVLLADAPHLDRQRAEPMATLLVSLAARYGALVAASTANAKNFMPRAAAVLDVMQISDATKIVTPDTFERPIYAGNAIETLRSRDRIKVITVRATAFPATAMGAVAAPIESVPAPADAGTSALVSEALSRSERPELTAARIVISGGRGLGSAENFARFIEPLALKLGAAIGASRAAVDAGYAPNDQQVGQTGKVVAPDLYIACGISGAIQHLAGMKESKVIVAINKDPEAPIFEVADYGLVADLFAALKEFENRLSAQGHVQDARLPAL